MNEEILKRYVGKTISLIAEMPKTDGNITKENYSGTIKEVLDNTLVLVTNSPTFYIKELIIDVKSIISVWVFRTKYKDYKKE